MTWENGRELASINSKTTNTPIVSFEYNSSGLRTYKNDIRYLYDDNGNLISEQRGDCALTYYYDGNGVRTHFTRQGEDGMHTYYYRYNLQGDVIALLDNTGTVVAEYNYTPYGEHIGTVTGIAAYNPFRYRGYYFDSETGYYYLQSRYYNPFTCRFINSDAILNIDFDGSNLFAYCNNDPVNYVDPMGYAVLVDDVIVVLGIFTFTAIAIICIDWQVQLSWSSFIDGTGALQYDYYKDEPDLEIHHNPNTNQSPSTILDVLPSPDTSEKEKKQKQFVFYEAYLMKPGISVLLGEPMGLEEAASWVLDGNNVWTMFEEDAIFLAIYASGGYVSGNKEAMVLSGENAFHYHLKGRYKGSHIFYDYQAVEFYFDC